MNNVWLLNFFCNTNYFDININYKVSRRIKSNEIIANKKERNTGRKVFVKKFDYLLNNKKYKKEY